MTCVNIGRKNKLQMAAKSKTTAEGSEGYFSSFLDENEKDHFNFVKPKEVVISSGSLALDSLIKIRSGSFVRLCGKGSELGKTSEAFVLARNYMKVMPNSKTLFIKAEARLTPEMQERQDLEFVTEPSKWKAGTVFVFSCNVFETIASAIEGLLPKMKEEGENLCIILDSLDGVILKADREKDIWSGSESVKVAGSALLLKILLRRLALQVVHYDVLFLLTSQYTAEIKLDPYSKAPPRQTDGSGGNAISHQTDTLLVYETKLSGDFILEKPDLKPDPVKNKTIGVYATVNIKKSSTDVSNQKVKIPIKRGRRGCAVWVEKEVADMIVAFELIKRAGAWYKFSEEIIELAKQDGVEIKEQHQGMNAVYEYIENDKAAFDWLYKKVQEIIS